MTPKDKRDPGFWITDNEIIEVHGRQIGPYGIAVYGALAMHAGRRGTCDPSIAAIAREIGVSPRKVRSTIGELATVGLIEVEHRPTGAGRNHEPNAYSILPVVKLAKYTGQPTAQGADATALSAEPLRRNVPNPTALSAYKEEQARTEQDSPVTVATDAPGELDQPDPPKQDAWLPLKLAIATTTTGKPKITGAKGAPARWIGEIVGDVGKLSGNDPETALLIWSAFESALTPDDREKYINAGNVGQRFAKWSLNGGEPAIRGVLTRRERDLSGEPRPAPDWMAA